MVRAPSVGERAVRRLIRASIDPTRVAHPATLGQASQGAAGFECLRRIRSRRSSSGLSPRRQAPLLQSAC
jgi:hypothetical protein